MSISVQGALETVITLKTSGDVNVDDIVTIHSNDTVKKSNMNDEILGIVISKSGDYAGVKITGAAKVKLKDSMKLGFQSIVAGNDNSIYSVAGALRNILVLNVDNASKTANIILM